MTVPSARLLGEPAVNAASPRASSSRIRASKTATRTLKSYHP
jgi:hypothetical protein